MEKRRVLYLLALIIMFFLNPFLSLLYNLYIFFVKEYKELKLLLIFNLSIINYFKIPNYGDYVSYIDFFYKFNNIVNLKNFLKYEEDPLFYFSMHLLNKLNFEYSEWAFIISFISYYFIFETIELIDTNKKNKFKYIYLFIYNPYYITRSALASSILIYAVIYYEKNGFKIKVIFYALLSALTHISTLFIPIYILIQSGLKSKKNKLLELRYPIIISITAFLCGNFSKEILIKFLIYFKVSLNYLSGDFVFENMNYIYKIKSILISYFIFIIPILMSYGVQKKIQLRKKINLSIIVMFFLLGFSPILARRLGIFILGILLCSIPGEGITKKIKVCIYSLFLISSLISYREYLYAGYYSKSYPFYLNRITKKLLKNNYRIKIDGKNRKIEIINNI